MPEENKNEKKQNKTSYTVEDAMKIADDIFKLGREKKYNLGAFIHGLILAEQYAQYSYKIPNQQIAMIKRDCKKYFNQIENINKEKK